MKFRFFFLFIGGVLFFATLGCTKKAPPEISKMTPEQLADRGKTIYQLNCISCHNPDPSKEGLLGPAILGSSKELLEERVLHAAYPAGYKPKRQTQQMPALPHLQKELPALEAFLTSVGASK